MCLDCGCHMPNNDHQDASHITLKDLNAAAAASGISSLTAASNIVDTLTDIYAAGKTESGKGWIVGHAPKVV